MMFAVSGSLATMACGLPSAMVGGGVSGPAGRRFRWRRATCAKYALNMKVIVIKKNFPVDDFCI
jgi:hypothetical protein